MQVHFAYNAIPAHEPFHRTAAREKAGIGAVGSGKTIALCGDLIGLGLSQPGSRIGVFRDTIAALKESTELEFVNLLASRREEDEDSEVPTLYDLCEVRKSGGHIDKIVLPNGSEYIFRGLDDWRKHMSLNFAAVGIDEASNTPVDAYNGLKTRLRQNKPLPRARELARSGAIDLSMWKRPRQYIALATNPNGHDWIWEYFVNAPTASRRWFRSTSFDNPYLYNEDGSPSDYLMSLLEMPEMWIRRFVLCEFDAFTGQILDFSLDGHVVEHFTPPADWERGMGLDWGLRNPTAVVWWARKPGTSKWFQYREWQTFDPTVEASRDSYITQDVHQIAAKIKQLEQGETIKYRAADPAIRNRQADSGKSVQYWFDYYGLHFQLGSKDYGTRINALNQMLTRGELSLMRNCHMTATAFQQYRWSGDEHLRDADGPERPHKKDDHLVDASQYLATLFYFNQPTPVERKIDTFDDEVWKAVTKQVRRQAQGPPAGPLAYV
jgi:hypothetical protein